MSVRRVRLYDGGAEYPKPDTWWQALKQNVGRICLRNPGRQGDVIGWSLSAAGATQEPKFAEWMEERGYSWRPSEPIPDRPSCEHTRVEPPIRDEDLQSFGEMCLEVVDGHHDGVEVYDNRGVPDVTPYGHAGTIITRGL